MTGFSGIWVPLVTPFRGDAIDFASLQALARRLVDAGASGLVACGSTGEAAALDEDEQLAVLDAVLAAVPGAPVMMGLAGNNLRAVLGRLERVQQRPVAGLLVPPPYYIRPSQAGLTEYFRTLADAALVPLVLYNIPYRTGVTMEFNTLAGLARHDRIVALKDCGGDPVLTMRLITETGLQVLAGEDHQLLSTLALGGSGGIMASAHLRTGLFVQIVRLVEHGALTEARDRFYRLLPLIRLLFREPNPGPLKAALSMMGWMDDGLRAPLQQATPALCEQIGMELKRLECA